MISTPSFAIASVVEYTSHAAWISAVSAPTSLGFGLLDPYGLYGPGVPESISLGAGPVAVGPLSFTARGQIIVPPISGLYNYMVVWAANVPYHCLGGDFCLESTQSGSFPEAGEFGEFSTAFLEIGLPENTDAFGINLDNEDADPTGTFVINISGIAESFSIATSYDSSVFFGFVSSAPVTDMSITQVGSTGLGSFTVESPAFATIPEPNTALPLGPLLMFLGMIACHRKEIKRFPL